MYFKSEDFNNKLYDAIVSRGLSLGSVNQYGQVCIQTAVCKAQGLKGTQPANVAPRIAEFITELNDCGWTTEKARAKALQPIGLAQLDTTDELHANVFFAVWLNKFFTKFVFVWCADVLPENPQLNGSKVEWLQTLQDTFLQVAQNQEKIDEVEGKFYLSQAYNFMAIACDKLKKEHAKVALKQKINGLEIMCAVRRIHMALKVLQKARHFNNNDFLNEVAHITLDTLNGTKALYKK